MTSRGGGLDPGHGVEAIIGHAGAGEIELISPTTARPRGRISNSCVPGQAQARDRSGREHLRQPVDSVLQSPGHRRRPSLPPEASPPLRRGPPPPTESVLHRIWSCRRRHRRATEIEPLRHRGELSGRGAVLGAVAERVHHLGEPGRASSSAPRRWRARATLVGVFDRSRAPRRPPAPRLGTVTKREFPDQPVTDALARARILRSAGAAPSAAPVAETRPGRRARS